MSPPAPPAPRPPGAVGWTQASGMGAGGRREEPRLGGKLPAGLFGFLRFPSRVVSPAVVRLSGTTPSAPPAPQSHSLLSSCSPTATLSKSAFALRTPVRGWVLRTRPTTTNQSCRRRRRTCPSRSGGSRRCGRNLSARRWQRVAIQRGGGRRFPFPAFSPLLPPHPSKRATCPGQSEGGWEWGGQRGQRVVPGHVPAQAPRPC